MFNTFFGAKRWRKAFYLLSPSSRGSIMLRVESRYVFPYIIENMKWKKKNLMKLNCAKYCILCMSSSDLWGHDLLRRFKGFCQKGMKGQAGRQKAPVFSHDANFCKHDGMVHHIFIIQRSDNFKYFFYSKAHTHINISKLYTTSHPLYFRGYRFCHLWIIVRRSHDFQFFANVNKSLQTSISTKVQKI